MRVSHGENCYYRYGTEPHQTLFMYGPKCMSRRSPGSCVNWTKSALRNGWQKQLSRRQERSREIAGRRKSLQHGRVVDRQKFSLAPMYLHPMRQHLPAEMNVVQATEFCKRPSLFGGIIYGQPSLAILYLATSCLKVVLDHSTTSAAHQHNSGSWCP